ncbi:MAG: hypothetical protein HY275_16030 [Gemmatimonadetes bacterium]|nr:hypothetical protein [Gemmatimonadota bacterium]
MSGAAKFDVRAPLGALFILLGAIVAVAGVTTPGAHPTGIAIATVWGGVMIAFGAVVSALAWRARGR